METKQTKEFSPTIFGKLSSIKRENDGKCVIITIDRNNAMIDYAVRKLEEMFGNKNVCLEFSLLSQYIKMQKILDADDEKQSKLA